MSNHGKSIYTKKSWKKKKEWCYFKDQRSQNSLITKSDHLDTTAKPSPRIRPKLENKEETGANLLE